MFTKIKKCLLVLALSFSFTKAVHADFGITDKTLLVSVAIGAASTTPIFVTFSIGPTIGIVSSSAVVTAVAFLLDIPYDITHNFKQLKLDAIDYLADGQKSYELERFYQYIDENFDEDFTNEQLASVLVGMDILEIQEI